MTTTRTKTTTNDYKQEYIQSCTSQGLSKETVSGYNHILNGFCEYLNDKGIDIQDIEAIHYRGYIDRLVGLSRKKTTIRLHSIVIKKFFEWLKDEDIVDVKMKELRIYKAVLPKIEVLQEQDIALLASVAHNDKRAIGRRDKAILLLISTSGLRASEVCGLKRQDIKTNKDGYIEIAVRGKGQKDRVVFTTQQAKRAIDAYLATRNDNNDALFLSYGSGGTRERALDRRSLCYMVHRRAKQAGLKNISPHTLRHYTATEMLRRGVNTSVVQKVMGHANISTTQRYTHITDRDVAEIYNAVMG